MEQPDGAGNEYQVVPVPVSRQAQTERGGEFWRHDGRQPGAGRARDEGTLDSGGRYMLLMPRDEAIATLIAIGIALLTIPIAVLRLPAAVAALVLVCIVSWAEIRVTARRALAIIAYVGAFIVVFQVLTAIMAAVVGGLLVPVEELAAESAVFEPSALSFVTVGAEVVALLTTALVLPRIQKRLRFTAVPTLSTLGMQLSGSRLLELGLGMLIGLGAISALVTALHVGGCLELGGRLPSLSAGSSPIAALAAYVVLLLAIAVCEEVALRGFALQNLGLYIGPVAAVTGSSLITAVLHVANPDFTPISLAGLFLLGVALASAYLATDSLWMPIGLHFGWNFTMGPVFGLNVSGLRTEGLLHPNALPDRLLWTGGDFGPEGGLAGVICLALLAACLTIVAQFRRRPPQTVEPTAS